MKKYQLKTKQKRLLADTVTPVNLYLKLRDRFPLSILLESSDYHGNENSYSYICCQPMANFQLRGDELSVTSPDGYIESKTLQDKQELVDELATFMQSFETQGAGLPFVTNGLFGYMAYDAVQSFEDISFSSNKNFSYEMPVVNYNSYRYVIVIDHFKNQLYLFEHFLEGDERGLDSLIGLINNKNYPDYKFEADSQEESNFNDQEFLKVLQKGKDHCLRGDVFQIVLSRAFNRSFKGDEFNLYRALRSVNPSPYLFYFDYGSFKIFGSSPEAQIIIRDRKAEIHPIAGTFRRTGDDQSDLDLAKKLFDDPKENSEHVMLVDLARNDLSRNGKEVEVTNYKEIQYYSHVIHLVSKVVGQLSEKVSSLRVVADTFPAGTLSGAPKYRAMELINTYEKTRRGYYGGAIGFLGFNGDFNHAIMIRSFLSKDNKLHYQAGAGVVAKSDINMELKEVDNKLAALREAIEIATSI